MDRKASTDLTTSLDLVFSSMATALSMSHSASSPISRANWYASLVRATTVALTICGCCATSPPATTLMNPSGPGSISGEPIADLSPLNPWAVSARRSRAAR